jgi:putative transposon-encoded protein
MGATTSTHIEAVDSVDSKIKVDVAEVDKLVMKHNIEQELLDMVKPTGGQSRIDYPKLFGILVSQNTYIASEILYLITTGKYGNSNDKHYIKDPTATLLRTVETYMEKHKPKTKYEHSAKSVCYAAMGELLFINVMIKVYINDLPIAVRFKYQGGSKLYFFIEQKDQPLPTYSDTADVKTQTQ